MLTQVSWLFVGLDGIKALSFEKLPIRTFCLKSRPNTQVILKFDIQ